MAFRFRQHESVDRGLRRVARKELERARAELRRTSPPSDEAVHDARKSVKKVRAVLQVVERAGGKDLSRCRKRLRFVNRVLSRLRDGDAKLVTLEQLRRRNPRLFSEHTFARLRHQLAREKRAAVQHAAAKDRFQAIDRRLRKVRRTAKHWRVRRRGFGAIAKSLRSTHRRGRDALKRALQTQQATDFHEWRKQMKALWYTLRLLHNAVPTVTRDVNALHRAETALGDEHNVVVLCAELTKDASICRGPLDADRLRLVADRLQCDLRKTAIASAKRVYRQTPADYVRRLKRAWKAPRRKRAAAA